MTISLTIPDVNKQLILDAYCNTFAYQAQIPNPTDPTKTIANPETKQQFIKKRIAGYIKDIVQNYEKRQQDSAFQPTIIDIT